MTQTEKMREALRLLSLVDPLDEQSEYFLKKSKNLFWEALSEPDVQQVDYRVKTQEPKRQPAPAPKKYRGQGGKMFDEPTPDPKYKDDEKEVDKDLDKAMQQTGVAQYSNFIKYTESPTVAVNEYESAKAILNSVALVAHCGGLIDLSEREALILIRKLTVQHHDWKQTIGDTRALLKLIAAAEEAKKGGAV